MSTTWLILLKICILSSLVYINPAYCEMKNVKNLTVLGNKAYVMNAYKGFEILDISNLDNIVTMSSVSLDDQET